MKYLFSVLVLLIMLPISGESLASAEMPSYQVPELVSVDPTGLLEIIFPVVFNSGCNAGNKIYVRVGNSQGVTGESFKSIQSFSLAALMAQRPIKFWYDRVDGICEGGKIAVSK